MIVRATDADFHNLIANHPEVKPTFGYNAGYTDLSPLLKFPEQYILLHDGVGAAALFDWSAPNVWEGHTLFHPDVRGKEGIRSAKAMLQWMFDHGAKMIWGKTPLTDEHKRTHLFNRLLGFKAGEERIDDAGGRVRLYTLEK